MLCDACLNCSRLPGFMAAAVGIAIFVGTSSSPVAFADEKPAVDATDISTFRDLQRHARQLSQEEFQPVPPLPQELADLDYDAYRMIGYRYGQGIGLDANRPFWLEPFHRGFVQHNHVSIYEITDTGTVEIPFSTKYFEYRGEISEKQIPRDLGFAGVRVAGRFPEQSDSQEIFTLLGGSYFRARAANQVYGSSARGLAIDIGMNKDEEFPAFRKVWFATPAEGATSLTMLALLDSPSVVGAYELVLHPGQKQTDVDVSAELYFRRTPEKLGIAPLTSMWMWGDGLKPPEGDHRPEVHDADGLLMETENGEWTYRAFARQPYPSVVRFPVSGLRGFGVIQRDTQRRHYRDDEAQYHARPSIWVTPQEPWKAGVVELLELPGRHEGVDNIAAWWVPEQPVEAGRALPLRYRVTFLKADPAAHRLAKAVAWNVDRCAPDRLVVSIEYFGPDLATQTDHAWEPHAEAIRGAVESVAIEERHGRPTAVVTLKPDGEGPIELTVRMHQDGRPVAETWKYLCPLEAPVVKLPPWRLRELKKEVGP